MYVQRTTVTQLAATTAVLRRRAVAPLRRPAFESHREASCAAEIASRSRSIAVRDSRQGGHKSMCMYVCMCSCAHVPAQSWFTVVHPDTKPHPSRCYVHERAAFEPLRHDSYQHNTGTTVTSVGSASGTCLSYSCLLQLPLVLASQGPLFFSSPDDSH